MVLLNVARPKAKFTKVYMKSTKKRFAEGGISEDKEAGLKASKGEDVGFFESFKRLGMGNIDDSKSEAYKRFGAGRGASEREFKNRASNDPTADRVVTPVVSMPDANVAMPDAPRRVAQQVVAAREAGEDLSPSERISEDYARPPGIPPTAAFAGKADTARKTKSANVSAPKRQTVYQAEKLGGRDKMSEPKVQDVEVPKPRLRADMINSIPLDNPREPVSGKSASGSELGRNITNTLGAMSGYQGINFAKAAAEGLTAKAAAKRAELAAAEKRAELAGELRRNAQPTKFQSSKNSEAAKRTRKFNDDEANVEMRKGGMTKKYANGGSVSASRGDGIAQRGKTRGKMC